MAGVSGVGNNQTPPLQNNTTTTVNQQATPQQDETNLQDTFHQTQRGTDAGTQTGTAQNVGSESTKQGGTSDKFNKIMAENLNLLNQQAQLQQQAAQNGQSRPTPSFPPLAYDTASDRFGTMTDEMGKDPTMQAVMQRAGELKKQTQGGDGIPTPVFVAQALNESIQGDQSKLSDPKMAAAFVAGNQLLSSYLASQQGGNPPGAPGAPGQPGGGIPNIPGQLDPAAQAAAGANGTTLPPGAAAAPTTSYTDQATRQKAVQDDLQQAQTIYMQMAADRQKWFMRWWQIMQDLQTSIFETIQGVAQRRQQAQYKASDAWSQVMRGG